MARLTAQQIAQMTPDISALLANQGIFISGENDDGSPRYVNSEGDLVSQGQVNELMQGGELPEFQAETLRDKGILSLGGSAMQDTLNSEYFNQGGQRFSTPVDYFNYLYGGKGEQVGDYYVLPEGMSYDQYTNAPLRYEPPTPLSTQLALLAIGGLATGGAAAEAGLFGGAGAGAGAGAAAEAAPTFVGGASGAGIAGGAAGGGTLSGLTAAEMAALGAGGAGAAAGGLSSAATGLSQAELAALIESGTSGLSGAGLETAGLAGQGLTAAQYAALQGGGSLGGFSEFLNSVIPGLNNGASQAIDIAKLLNGGSGGSNNLLGLLGTLGQTGAGIYAGDKMADAYKDVSQQFLNMGQPYRDRLNATYDPNWSFADTPDMQRSSQAAMDQASRALSTKFGNPADSPSAIGELLKYGIDNNLSKSFDYRNQLGQFGGLGAAPVQAGATAGLLGTKAQGGIYEALGSGFENLTNPFKLNNGFSF